LKRPAPTHLSLSLSRSFLFLSGRLGLKLIYEVLVEILPECSLELKVFFGKHKLDPNEHVVSLFLFKVQTADFESPKARIIQEVKRKFTL
jgi:hypothetical protein